MKVQKEAYLCFIDYTKVLRKVQHNEITHLKIDEKDLRVIKNMIWEQMAAMRVGGEISSFKKIKPDMRQRCMDYQAFFSLYSEIIMQNLEEFPGIKVGEHKVKNFRYADNCINCIK